MCIGFSTYILKLLLYYPTALGLFEQKSSELVHHGCLLSTPSSPQHQKIRHRFNNKPCARVINLGVLFYVFGLYPSHCFVIWETTPVNAKHSFLVY